LEALLFGVLKEGVYPAFQMKSGYNIRIRTEGFSETTGSFFLEILLSNSRSAAGENGLILHPKHVASRYPGF